MPKQNKYNSETAKQFLLRYGYEVKDPHYVYHNLTEKINLRDIYNEKDVRLSMGQVERQVYKAATKRPEFNNPNDIMNIDYQPGRVQLSHNERK